MFHSIVRISKHKFSQIMYCIFQKCAKARYKSRIILTTNVGGEPKYPGLLLGICYTILYGVHVCKDREGELHFHLLYLTKNSRKSPAFPSLP